MQCYELECCAEKWVSYPQGEGESEGLNNQNMTVSTITNPFATKLGLMVHHLRPVCFVEKKERKEEDKCVPGQGHNEG